MSPVSHQGTDAVQAPRASRLVNGSLALTVRFVNAGSCLDQPDEALGMAPEGGNVGWGLGVTRGGDIQRGSSSHQLHQALQLVALLLRDSKPVLAKDRPLQSTHLRGEL